MITAMPFTRFPWYSWMMLGGIAITLIFWTRLARRDERLLFIYIAALGGAFIGAKIVYLLCEGWLYFGKLHMWTILATGKSILGALLGGYVAVEAAKRLSGYRAITGDWFAMLVPVGVIVGRVGCLLNGCCLGVECPAAWYAIRDYNGVPRWPSVPVEILFNALAIAALLVLRRKKLFPGQHFHLYLIGYGLFRFLHEFLRATPHVVGPLSGYQLAALAVAALGLAGFERRRRDIGAPAPLAAEY
jgi:phosphatidylglycerol:prolipoprotein diacylglycerol transferase